MPGILVITTGGTIGALAHPDPRNPPHIVPMPPDGRDIVREALRSVFQSFNARCISLEPRDSKFIDQLYLTKIVTLIETAPENEILITFGTDAILAGADFFYQERLHNRRLDSKTLIFTGAMTPLANGTESDGHRNMAFALDCLHDDKCGQSRINIVLCHYDQTGVWTPHLYSYQPHKYEKFYDADGRYNRLRLKS